MNGKWISVRKELPAFGVPVLCCFYPKHPVMEGRVAAVLRRFNTLDIPVSSGLLKNFDQNGFPMASEVTHWMPIEKFPELLES